MTANRATAHRAAPANPLCPTRRSRTPAVRETTRGRSRNVIASVSARLLNLAHARDDEFQLVLMR